MKMGRKYVCLMGSGNLVDLLAYEFIIVLKDIEFDSAVMKYEYCGISSVYVT